MKVLFCNYNFPGQLGPLATWLARKHEVLFASCYERRSFSIPGVRRVLTLLDRRKPPTLADPVLQPLQLTLAVGRQVRSTLERVKASGFMPDIVACSSMNGPGLFVRDVFPEAFHVVYMDEALTRLAMKRGEQGMAAMWLLGHHVLRSDMLGAFTEYQRHTCPEVIRPQIHSVPVCVDEDFFSLENCCPVTVGGEPLDRRVPVVTIDCKGRCDPVKAIWPLAAGLLSLRANCHVVLMCDGAAQTQPLEARAASIDPVQRKRLHILDFLRRGPYRDVLCASTVHLCPTGDEVLLAGELEAMSCGAVLLAPASAGNGVLIDGVNMFAWPAPKQGCATRAQLRLLVDVLDRAPQLDALRAAARKMVMDNFSQSTVMPRHVDMLAEARERWLDRPGR